jgi:hypothetical protein
VSGTGRVGFGGNITVRPFVVYSIMVAIVDLNINAAKFLFAARTSCLDYRTVSAIRGYVIQIGRERFDGILNFLCNILQARIFLSEEIDCKFVALYVVAVFHDFSPALVAAR